MTPNGHLFVVHGRVEDLVHDAAIVPVDGRLDFNDSWRPLLGEFPEAPARWSEGWGQVRRDVWIVQVGDGDYNKVLERLGKVLDDVEKRQLTPAGRRLMPLVALPVLGIRLGGHRHEQGHVLRRLVDFASQRVEHHPVDIALVTPEASVYAAAQFARHDHPAPLSPASEQLAERLGTRAKRDELALFLGAGVSIPAGLPSWEGLLAKLTKGLTADKAADVAKLESPTDQAELIQLAIPDEFQSRVSRVVSRRSRPGLLHALLAGMDVRRAVTTNYDRLYETACKAAGHEVTSVMPRQSATGAPRWVLKLHGDVKRKKSIVLTRRHMVRYDAANRPSASVLQSLLLTHHLLVIGASLGDDNVVRLALEVQAYRETHQSKNSDVPFGTVLDASPDGDTARAALWKGQLAWHHLAGGDLPSTRTLEIFLDRVGLHASRDSSWLLDQRFGGLLTTARDVEIARQARALRQALGDADDRQWESLRAALRAHGA